MTPEKHIPFEGTGGATPKNTGHQSASKATPSTTWSNDLDCATGTRHQGTFNALRDAFAARGHSLHRTDPTDGPVTYWVERWGLIRYLPTIDVARRFLEQIGGRL